MGGTAPNYLPLSQANSDAPLEQKNKKMLHLKNVNLVLLGKDARLCGKGELAFKRLH